MLKMIGELCQKNGGGIPMDTLPQKEVKPKEKLMKVSAHSCLLLILVSYLPSDKISSTV